MISKSDNNNYKGHALRIVVGFLMVALFFAYSSSAATLTVNASGGAMFTKIQDAIDDASAGDTILVDSGTYYENVDVNKQLILRGNNTGGGKPAVDAGGSGNAIVLRTGFITLEGFIVVNCGSGIRAFSNDNIIRNNTASNCDYGIYLSGSSSNIIDNNTMNQNQYGISLESSYLGSSNNNTLIRNIMIGNTYNLLFGDFGYSVSDFDNNIDTSNLVDGKPLYYIENIKNVVYDSSIDAGLFYCISCINVVFRDMILNNGIYLINTSNSRIQNTTCHDNSVCISLFKSENNMLIGNNVSNSGYGISLFESKNNTLGGNNASNNSYGIILRFFSFYNILISNNASNNSKGIVLVESSINILSENNISSNREEGILMNSGGENILNSNSVSNNSYGIVLNSGRNTINRNNIFNNKNGIIVQGNDNRIFHNNLINNINQAYDGQGQNAWDLGFPNGGNYGGNYWNDYNGTDVNNDGYGDVPYNISSYAKTQDRYPFIEQNGWVSRIQTPLPYLNGTVTGKVIDYESGIPLVNVPVRVGSITTITNADGIYNISIAPGSYSIEIIIIINTSWINFEYQTSSGFTVASEATVTHNFDLHLPPEVVSYLNSTPTMDYDLNHDGHISKSEALAAVADYFSGLISKQQALSVVMQYFQG